MYSRYEEPVSEPHVMDLASEHLVPMAFIIAAYQQDSAEGK